MELCVRKFKFLLLISGCELLERAQYLEGSLQGKFA